MQPACVTSANAPERKVYAGSSGMGEPLANPRVFDTLKLLTDSRAFGMSARRLSISTSGVLPGIKKLNQQHPQVRCMRYYYT